MIDVWWAALIGAVCFLAGVTITLIVCSFIQTRPMDGRTWTGELPPHLRGDE